MIFTTVLSLLALAVVSSGSPMRPIQPHQLEVISPAIIWPAADVKWAPGSTHNVTWNTSMVPEKFCNNTGTLLLGYITPATKTTPYSENLNISHPLATGFRMGTGHTAVTIPKDTRCRANYVVVLFGDSGNISPQFSIAN
ncbi:hypothetical protein C8J57DRAFT_1706653 [Mycena rebaudengoi]|nr:hypothetical protein C8J57DRAFT_1706653 [Mycena rebaudengoi]